MYNFNEQNADFRRKVIFRYEISTKIVSKISDMAKMTIFVENVSQKFRPKLWMVKQLILFH